MLHKELKIKIKDTYPSHGSFPCHGKRACITLWSHEPRCAGPLRWAGHSAESWQNMVHWRTEWQTTPGFLTWEPQEQYEKAKRYDIGRWAPQAGRCPDLLLGKSAGQLVVAPERMKQLGQSRNDALLWMCLVVKEKSDAIKNNIAQEPGMLGPWIKVNWMWSSRRWQEWTLIS